MPFSKKPREDILRRARFMCCWCHVRRATHVHHIIPESEDGPDTEDNAAPLCPTCHDLYGANPDKRNFIRQIRDFWYEECERVSPPELIREALEGVTRPLATKEDVKKEVDRIITQLQQITDQPVSTTVQLRQISDATAAFSFATFQAMQDKYIVVKKVADQLGITPQEVTDDQYVSVEELDLSRSGIKDLTPLQGLTNLQYLNLWDTQVSDLTPLQGLTNLQELGLSCTPVSDLTPLQGLTNLQDLDLSFTQVSDLTPLQALTNLQRLRLTRTRVTHLAPLRGLTNLQKLNLNNSQVSDLIPLQGLTNLQDLDLTSTPVSDLTPLHGLTKLQVLCIADTQVGKKQVASLKKALPQLEIYGP